MSTQPEMILEQRTADVVTLRFHDPERRNAMTRAMGEAFAERIAALAGDTSIRAVVLTGSGSAFSAGGDLGMLDEQAAQGQAGPGVARFPIRDAMRGFYKLFLSVRDLPCPSIAAINGHAIGAGLCVALGCDIRLVANEAKLGLNFTKLGLHPGMAATWTLPRLVGPAVAAELLYTSRLFSGEEAARIGLANRALPADEVLAAGEEIAREIAACAPLAVRGVKRALARTGDASIEDQLTFEASEQAICFESRDALEGIQAARERRSPNFKGN
ncbi:MAG: enoyl-CoA hydratase/isomerase family protein [Myxococcota bacterium]|nr:enoyl-CoA hydratase/isomerase family protein [Myxococcota bacterium]